MCVSVLAGTHQRRGSLAVLGIYIRATAEEQLHHGNTAMPHCKHKCRLACLERAQSQDGDLNKNLTQARYEKERDVNEDLTLGGYG